HEHSGAAVEPLDSLAIPPQHDRCCRDGQFCDGRFGGLLPIDETARRVRRLFVRVGVVAGLVATLLMVFPTGDGQGRMVAEHQPVTLAAMEGLFETAAGAPLALLANRTWSVFVWTTRF